MPAEPPQLGPGDAVMVVDVQRDFCAGGSLAVPEGDRVIGVLNGRMGAAVRVGIDTHVLCQAARPVDAEAGAQALREMKAAWRRCAKPARREESSILSYSSDEQRSWLGCSGARRPSNFDQRPKAPRAQSG